MVAKAAGLMVATVATVVVQTARAMPGGVG